MSQRRTNSGFGNPVSDFIKNLTQCNTPADIDRLVERMDRMKLTKEEKKFFVYINERKVYNHDPFSREYLNLCLASFFALGSMDYNNLTNWQLCMPLELLQTKTVSCFPLKPGLQQEVLDLLELKTESHPKRTRVVCMFVDESMITPEVINIDDRPYG
nr:unnamed protein product [Callosobruchus analis]